MAWLSLFFKNNLKPILIGFAALTIISGAAVFAKGYIDGIEDRVRLECNTAQLQDRINQLEEEKRQAEIDRNRFSEELQEIEKEVQEREKYIDRLQFIINNQNLQDDEISERTRQFIIELNNRNIERYENTSNSDR